jgi:hypothetical protein
MAGVSGTYNGVPGYFTCSNVACTLTQQTEGKVGLEGPSDSLNFTPNPDAMVFADDTDWLTAGVWLTVPDDPEGDYAVGAFAYGNNPYKTTNLNALEGEATYEGNAFGRYAKQMGVNKALGGFTAKASLKADFGAAGAAGIISGGLSEFMAGGETQNWSVNLEAAELTSDETSTTVRFNAGASGHASGHGLTGFWNGQFYGPAAADAMPSSAAGTFGLTSERDPDDNFSLTLIGAFGAHVPPPADDSDGNGGNGN